MLKSGRRLVVGCGFLLFLSAARAGAQDVPVELQETEQLGMGARAMGMGGGTVAVSDDLGAIWLNPAGLVQLRVAEIAGGMVFRDREREVTHLTVRTSDFGSSRLEHLGFAVPAPLAHAAFAFSYRRLADLDDVYFKEGFLVPLHETSPGVNEGLYELEDYRRDGAMDAWTTAGAIELTPNISLGGSVTYISGSSTEDLVLANYRALDTGDEILLDVLDPSNPPGFDTALQEAYYELRTFRESDIDGWTGAFSFLARGGGWRLGGSLELPEWIDEEGTQTTILEDAEKIDTASIYFHDDITLPLSLRGGLSWTTGGLLLAGGMRWTDYSEIDYGGEILAPPSGPSLAREPAYRSVVAWQAGAELRFAEAAAVRGGFYTEPLPYQLIAADTDFQFVPDDGDSSTLDDISRVGRDYPEARITSDRTYVTAGLGLTFQKQFSLDAAYVHGWWDRETPPDYENGTDFYPTTPTVEKVTEDRIIVTATARFR